jgi:hypothetical protein
MIQLSTYPSRKARATLLGGVQLCLRTPAHGPWLQHLTPLQALGAAPCRLQCLHRVASSKERGLEATRCRLELAANSIRGAWQPALQESITRECCKCFDAQPSLTCVEAMAGHQVSQAGHQVPQTGRQVSQAGHRVPQTGHNAPQAGHASHTGQQVSQRATPLSQARHQTCRQAGHQVSQARHPTCRQAGHHGSQAGQQAGTHHCEDDAQPAPP